MLIPIKVIEAVAKEEENLGYYINIGVRNIERANYKNTSWNERYYDGYIINLYKIPTKSLKLMLKHWDDLDKKEFTDANEPKVFETFNENKKELSVFLQALANTKMRKAKNLDDALSLLQTYFRSNLKDNGWVYRKDHKKDRHYPFVVKMIQIEQDRHDSRRRWIEISLVNNTRNQSSTSKIVIESSNLKEHKNSIPDVVRANNILFETDELAEEYQEYIKDYYEKEVMQSSQFIDDSEMRYVNDNLFEKEKNLGRFNSKLNLFTSSTLVQHADNCPIPFEPLVYTYNLNKHEFVWMDTRDLEEYQYDHKIVEKLILPKEHKGLINILTNDVINDNGTDIIKGKSGGTIILCKGKAGLGKTLTAEIYSELKNKPLYSVHSSQLGTNGNEIEEALKEAFTRSERWGAVLLIDEADVYIRERDNDTNHNAIVASFLRVMEYYSGLMFMTTNREKDIDDAILSRCMSVLTYKFPIKEVKSELWSIYLKQFHIEYDEVLIEELNNEFEEISGRDIKNISRLASRYMQGYEIKEPTLQVFIECAIYRGVKEI